MHLIGERIFGGLVVILLATLVVVKRAATGSVLDRPTGGPLVQLVNVFNLCFLLVVNPVAAVLLILGGMEALDPTHLSVGAPWALAALEVSGLSAYVLGFGLMAWALATLRRSYQLGGLAPRAGDALVADGPYRVVRHPMYAAATAIALGLASALQSGAVLAVFAAYVALIVPLIAAEERGLLAAYGARYGAYRARTWRLVPLVY